jgi:phenylpropionate dioxygenase-like ring-hydroxylating dioxygenase large terminal subunit
MRPTPTGSFVDAENGFVRREAFTSDDVYRTEFDQIFDRSWIYLGHESEIPAPGDYVTRRLGSAPVIVVRTDDGEVRALLNTCRHRGTKLCRGDAGRAANFVCPYHGWSYRNNGELVTTTFNDHFPENTDFSQFNLVPVPRLERRYGMIFGCWDSGVISLDEYLGDVSWYLKSFFDRTPGGMEILGPPHRWAVDSNWKVGALNFIGDSQHVATTHAGPITLDRVRAAKEGFSVAGQDSFQVVTDEGHGCTLTYLAPGMPAPNYETHNPELQQLYDEKLAPDQIGMLHNLRVCVGNVFPHLSFIETQADRGQKAVILRLWQPTSGKSMEVLSWVFAEKEASDEYKDNVLKKGFHNFGAAGVFEQDDMELWISATDASDNPIAAQFPYSFHTALPYMNTTVADYEWPGRAYRPSNTEVAQFEFMRHWDRQMQSNAAGQNGEPVNGR